jgi:hypothetical protein
VASPTKTSEQGHGAAKAFAAPPNIIASDNPAIHLIAPSYD